MESIASDNVLSRYDAWTEEWNLGDPDAVRRSWIEFLLDWRAEADNWFQQEAGEFFDRVGDRVDLPETEGIAGDLKRLHLSNNVIWNFEDEARRDDVSAERILTIKRGIDAVNQLRNDQMEKIDEYFVRLVQAAPEDDSVPMHTEPPGLMMDRLSILSLKLYHYGLQEGSDEVATLSQQREDLGEAYDRFREDLGAGEKQVKVYRQFKTYNDPETNPALSTED